MGVPARCTINPEHGTFHAACAAKAARSAICAQCLRAGKLHAAHDEPVKATSTPPHPCDALSLPPDVAPAAVPGLAQQNGPNGCLYTSDKIRTPCGKPDAKQAQLG